METNRITVRINGADREVPEGNVVAMLESLGIVPASVVLEINEEVAPRTTWPERPVRAGDRIEILKFVGGG